MNSDPRPFPALRNRIAAEIGESNAACALDFPNREYETIEESIAAYAVNVVDTCRERRVSAEAGMRAFLAAVSPGA